MTMLPLERLEQRMKTEVLSLCLDSRKATPGCVFVARHGSGVDGQAFIAQAVEKGAAYVVCTPEAAEKCGTAVAVACENPALAVAQLAAARWGTADLPFPLVGVTGTNGKTTITYLLDHLFASTKSKAGGRKTGVLGTVSYRWPGHCEQAPMTTPDGPDVHAMLAEMAVAGVENAFMEVSSHALDQHRVDGLPFSGAVFTNLTQDHLDYHKTIDHYFAAKARLFLELPKADKAMAVGVDNPWGVRLLEQVAQRLPHTAARAIAYGLEPNYQGPGRYMHGEVCSSSTSGLLLRVRFEGRTWESRSPLVGAYNAENLLATQAMGLALGLEPAAFACFEDFCGVPGRLERIRNPQGLDVFVDYAHTPDALANMLTAVRGAGFKRVVCVFGCGGNRDRAKRPLMGEAVARLAQVAVLTSDNPRNEEPEAILADTLPGLAKAALVIVEGDRRKAIAKALDLLEPGDALVVAGKGHENTQEISGIKYPFSDQETIREILACV